MRPCDPWRAPGAPGIAGAPQPPPLPPRCCGGGCPGSHPLVTSHPPTPAHIKLQVCLGAHHFTYDHVFGPGATPASFLYDRCVAPLVDGLFAGYNATVFAYGQTGSGKTYTMGSAFGPGSGGDASRGVIPRCMAAIFERMRAAGSAVDFTVRVGFSEIHKASWVAG